MEKKQENVRNADPIQQKSGPLIAYATKTFVQVKGAELTNYINMTNVQTPNAIMKLFPQKRKAIMIDTKINMSL